MPSLQVIANYLPLPGACSNGLFDRHELLPQPHHDHSNPGAPGPSNTSPGPSNSSSPSPEGGGGSGSRDGMGGSGGGLFGSLFNILNPGGGSRREGSDERPVHERRGSSGLNSTRRSGIGSGTRRARSTEGRDDEREFPGGYHWDAGVD